MAKWLGLLAANQSGITLYSGMVAEVLAAGTILQEEEEPHLAVTSTRQEAQAAQRQASEAHQALADHRQMAVERHQVSQHLAEINMSELTAQPLALAEAVGIT
jgi:hypothetical protein